MIRKSPVRRRWLVTGATGMLGRDMVAVLESAARGVTAFGRGELDILDAAAVHDAVDGHDVVVNCAAWTAVDDAESHEDDAYAVNALGAQHLARAAAAHGARIVQISTDYVFDGRSQTPYAEDATPNPVSAYGRTKLAGEELVRAAAPDHLVVRTAWLYGRHGACFPRTIARLARERGALAVVDDQRGQPTWTRDVADLVVRLVDAEVHSGTFHATSSGETTWFDFAREVVAAAGLDPSLVTATSSDTLTRPAPRPSYSVLGHGSLERAGIDPIGPWRDRWREARATVLAADV